MKLLNDFKKRSIVRTLLNIIFAVLLYPLLTVAATAAERISLSGTVKATACAQACGTCCGAFGITDSSGNLFLPVGNSFTELTAIADDGEMHLISGHYYDTAGQCGVGVCSLFAVESIDTPLSPAAVFQPASGRLSIQAVVIDGAPDTSYAVTLDAPFNVTSVVADSEVKTIPQGGDCAADNAVCSSGTQCMAYYGIAGPSGPEFKTCEIPCSHPGASCPLGQSCATIADGPGQVCTVD